jgi:hypothetical protein
MLIVVPVSEHDRGLIDNFCEVVNFLGPYSEKHQLLTVFRPSDACYGFKVFEQLADSFKVSNFFKFEEDGPKGWPAGPNNYWYQTIKHLEKIKNTLPWLWMELDMTPIETNWLDALEFEYIHKNKDFLGILQTIAQGTHFVGAGVYPADFFKRYTSWKTVTTQPLAFDVFCQKEIVPNACTADTMDHKFRTTCFKCTNLGLQGIVDVASYGKHPEFLTPVKKTAVLVHGCVDSSLACLILNKSNRAFESRYNELSARIYRDSAD